MAPKNGAILHVSCPYLLVFDQFQLINNDMDDRDDLSSAGERSRSLDGSVSAGPSPKRVAVMDDIDCATLPNFHLYVSLVPVARTCTSTSRRMPYIVRCKVDQRQSPGQVHSARLRWMSMRRSFLYYF